MTATVVHRVRRYISQGGYTAVCACGWRGTWLTRPERDQAADRHLESS